MKRIAYFTPLLCTVIFGGTAALAVDLDSLNGAPSQTPKVASAMRPYGEEVAAPYQTDFTMEEPAVPEKWISGNIVGSWCDGFLQTGNRWNMNQAWLTVQKSVDSNMPVDYGYHVDAIFGTNNLQCFGDGGFDGKWGVSEDGYCASIYQAYAELGLGKLSGKFGKFGTLLGFEDVNAANNAFATHSHMFNNEPTTHTGGLFTWAPDDALELNVGLVAGSDNSWQNKRGDTGFLFGATLTPAEGFSISYASELCQVHSRLGEQRVAQSGGYYLLGGANIGDQNEYLQTFTASLDLSEQLSYSFVSNYGTMEDRATRTHRFSQYGFANYLIYSISDQLTSAVRTEYYYCTLRKAEDSEGKIYDVSYGLTYKPVENIFILPEVRYDWINVAGVKSKGVTGAVACGIVF